MEACVRSKSTLSNIPEQLALNEHVYLMLIGAKAWKLSESFCKWSSEEFFTETNRGFQSSRSRKKKSGCVNYLSDHPPMSCTVMVKKSENEMGSEEGATIGSPREFAGNPQDSMQGAARQDSMPAETRGGSDDGGNVGMASSDIIRTRSSGNQRRSNTRQSKSSINKRSSQGRESTRSSIFGGRFRGRSVGRQASTYNEFEALPGHKAVKVYCFPVEHFSESVPLCRNVEQWRALCMVFLMDGRMSDGAEQLRDLNGRLGEVQRWVGNFIQASDIKSAPAQLQVVFQHHDSSSGEPEEPTEKEQAFIARVREVAEAPKSERIHLHCNFDDTKSFSRRLTEVLSSLLESRHGDDYDFQPEFLDMLLRKEQDMIDIDANGQHPCCAAM